LDLELLHYPFVMLHQNGMNQSVKESTSGRLFCCVKSGEFTKQRKFRLELPSDYAKLGEKHLARLHRFQTA
jgi:hypothetical protein